MFKPINVDQEKAILASAQRSSKGPDFSTRTVTHWFTLTQHQKMSFCTVPSHYENVPDTDYKGEKYDKYPTRMCVTIEPYEVCRWCFWAEADKLAALENLPPTERSKA